MGALLSQHAPLELFDDPPSQEHVLEGEHVRAGTRVLARDPGDTERIGFTHVQPGHGAPVHVSGVRVQVRVFAKSFFLSWVGSSTLTPVYPQIAHR